MTRIEPELSAALDRHRDALLAISHDIHAHPEVAFEERHAHAVLTDFLAGEGFTVERAAYGLETAFRAEISSGPGPRVAVICEYDALPEVGHACGHNVIGAAGVGAAVLATAALGAGSGTVVVLGTPAEESGGGKVIMLERGAFDGLDAAMMVHPAGRDLTWMDAVAIERRRVTYHGKAAHAAAAPHQGLNALDAAVLGYINVAALRQHLRPDERVHGVITHGGVRANVIPEHAEAEWFARSPSLEGLRELSRRMRVCLEAGAEAAGCTSTEVPLGRVYEDLRSDAAMVELYVEAARALGRVVQEPDASTRIVGSTDMGNVSHLVASMHPMIKAAPDDVALHTRAFAQHAGSAEGDRAVLDGALAMASVVTELLRPAAEGRVRTRAELRRTEGAVEVAGD